MIWLLFMLMLMPATAAAQVHKCTVDGATVFSDRPCPQTGPTVRQSLQDKAQAAQKATQADAECQQWQQTQAAIYNSVWDGSVHEVERWLKRNLNNPKSLQIITWGKVLRHCNGYAVRVQFRATNALGALVIESRIFRFDRTGQHTGNDSITWAP